MNRDNSGPDQVHLVPDHDDRLGVEVAWLPKLLQDGLCSHQAGGVSHAEDNNHAVTVGNWILGLEIYLEL